MSNALLLATLLGALLPDHSHTYFRNLSRPSVEQIDIRANKGPMIVIVVDALRPDRLSPYGFQRNTTPNLSKLADDGLILTNYFVNGNWTRPSTASLLTGELPVAHTVQAQNDVLPAASTTFVETLRSRGIPTGAVIGNGNASSTFGMHQGFDFYADTVKHWKGLPSAEQVTSLALPFIEKHRDEPFFLLLFTVDAHDPYHAPAPYENMFVEDDKVRLVRSPHWERERLTPPEITRMKATYDGAVRYTDTVLGNFIDDLKRLKVYDDATIIVTSDHGEAFGEHGVFLHAHHLYDEIIRAPFIIRAPHMSQRGGYAHYLYQSVDLAPTILAHFGLAPNWRGPGIDIRASLKAPTANVLDRLVISEFNNFGIRRRSIRSHSEKVIMQLPANQKDFMATVGNPSLLPSVRFDTSETQFFDLAQDPFETRNVFTKRSAKQKRWQRLMKQLHNHNRRYTESRPSTTIDELDPETYQDLKALGYID